MLKAFSFRNVEQQRAQAREIAALMLEGWIEDGRVELIGQLTEYYPIRVMSRMIGIPQEDIPRFAGAAHELHLLAAVPMAPGFPRLEAALGELTSYVRDLVTQRRAHPRYPQGTRIILNLLAASRDPEKFPDPDRFDITRVTDESRLPFGWGVHRCLGQPLARLLIEEGLTLLTSRMTDVAVVSRERGPHPAEMLSGPEALTLTFSRR